MGLNIEGQKEILGIYLSNNESASYWLNVLTELQNRGVKDILVACIDGLSGFPGAILSIFPKTEIQLCIIHQIRNSLKYVASKNQKAFMKDLKLVYRASSLESAESALDELEEKWGTTYPLVIKSWRRKWGNLSTYFKYPEAIRRIIYTTNAVEAIHRQFRKLTHIGLLLLLQQLQLINTAQQQKKSKLFNHRKRIANAPHSRRSPKSD